MTSSVWSLSAMFYFISQPWDPPVCCTQAAAVWHSFTHIHFSLQSPCFVLFLSLETPGLLYLNGACVSFCHHIFLASHLWGWGSIPGTASSGKAGSCLPLVGSLQYRTLTNCMYWFPLPFQLPVVMWPVQCWKRRKIPNT